MTVAAYSKTGRMCSAISVALYAGVDETGGDDDESLPKDDRGMLTLDEPRRRHSVLLADSFVANSKMWSRDPVEPPSMIIEYGESAAVHDSVDRSVATMKRCIIAAALAVLALVVIVAVGRPERRSWS